MEYRLIVAIFEKSTALRFMNCLDNKKPFEPADKERGWTTREMFILSGVLFFYLVVANIKTNLLWVQQKTKDKPPTDISNQPFIDHKEYREAEVDIRMKECFGVIKYIGGLVIDLQNGKYDTQHCDKEIHGIEVMGELPTFKLHPVSENFKEIP
jgi:hypothetical protein